MIKRDFKVRVIGRSWFKESMLAGLAEAIEKGESTQAFWEEHSLEFLKLYPDKFVAADDTGVIAVDDDLLELFHKVEALGRDPTDMRIKHFPTDPKNQIV